MQKLSMAELDARLPHCVEPATPTKCPFCHAFLWRLRAIVTMWVSPARPDQPLAKQPEAKDSRLYKPVEEVCDGYTCERCWRDYNVKEITEGTAQKQANAASVNRRMDQIRRNAAENDALFD